MPRPKPAPFPFDAVHELLGVCRAMALATPVAERRRRKRLYDLGGSLVRALEAAYANDDDRGSAAYRAAWKEAAEATRLLGEEVQSLMPAEPLQAAEADDEPSLGSRKRRSG